MEQSISVKDILLILAESSKRMEDNDKKFKEII